MTDHLLFPYADAFEHSLHQFLGRVSSDFAKRAGMPMFARAALGDRP